MAEDLLEIQMPAMGESVTEGTILEWHVAEGQEVSEGDTIVEVSTDKIDAEVPAPASGVITKIMAQPDDTVSVGQVLAQLDTNGTGNGAAPAAELEDPETASTPTPDPERAQLSRPDTRTTAPAWAAAAARATRTSARATPKSSWSRPGRLGRRLAGARRRTDGGRGVRRDRGRGNARDGRVGHRGTVLEWAVAVGDSVAEGDTVVEVSTDKVDAEVPAPAAGTITKLSVEPDDVVAVGQPLAELAAGAPRRRGPTPSGRDGPDARAGV